ncbi:MAG: HEAT repeat domain-containing protein [Vicinamibacteria bacterium]|nr:HEAT repeat domain-containing protein [Vicinamibacteria bacterium]
MRAVLLISITTSMALLLSSCVKKDQQLEIAALIKGLRSIDEDTQGKATADLVKIGEPAVPAVLPLLSDPDPRIRRTAATTLWGMEAKGRGAVTQLADALSDEDASVRASVAMALSAIGPHAKSAVPALIRTLHDQDSNVRLWTVKALGAIGPAAEKALPALESLLKDEFLGRATAEAVQKIKADSARESFGSSAAPSPSPLVDLDITPIASP